jgi:hypothetical protein
MKLATFYLIAAWLASVTQIDVAFAAQPLRRARGVLSRRRRLDGKKSPKERECELSESDDEIEFECKSKTEDEEKDTEIKDKIDYQVMARSDRGIVIKVSYEQELETDEEEVELETEYEVIFDSIVEYAKGGNSVSGPQYDFENDEVLQTLSLKELGAFSSVVDDEDGSASHFSVATPDGIAGFTFTINRASEGDAITANQMKIDFLLEQFPWIRDDTHVALISSVETEREMEVEYDDDDDDEPRDVVIDFADVLDGSTFEFVPFGEYTWQHTAQVRSLNATELNATEAALFDDTIEVIASSPKTDSSVATSRSSNLQETKKKEVIAFSFVGRAARSAKTIYWDPEAGIGYAEASGVSSVATCVGGVVSVIGMLLVTL